MRVLIVGERLLKTWNAHTPKVYDLIVSNIKADLACRIVA